MSRWHGNNKGKNIIYKCVESLQYNKNNLFIAETGN